MTPREMEAACLAAIDAGTRISLTIERGKRMPPGFPRGELLSVNERLNCSNFSYKPQAVLRWLRENMLIEAVSETAPSRKAVTP